MFITVGITTMDLFVSGLDKMPAFGGDEFTVNNLAFADQPLTMVMGGNGAICAYTLAKLGAPVVLCSAVGRDTLGDMIWNWLDAAHVYTAGLLRTRREATSTTTVITDRRLNRVSFHHPGASVIYRPVDLPVTILQQAGVLVLSSYSLLPAWRPDGFAQALQVARQADMITALDIGPAIGQPAALAELAPMLPNVDYFICNAHELSVCTGAQDLEKGIAQILNAGARYAVIKRGRDGAVIRTCDGVDINIPGFAVEARFTVGAGDAFNGGFLYGIHEGWDLYHAARFANAVAALVVSGAQGALGAPTRFQAEALLEPAKTQTPPHA